MVIWVVAGEGKYVVEINHWEEVLVCFEKSLIPPPTGLNWILKFAIAKAQLLKTLGHGTSSSFYC